MAIVYVRNGDVNQALKVLKRKWEVSIAEAVKRKNKGYQTRGERQRKKRMRGRARWRKSEQERNGSA